MISADEARKLSNSAEDNKSIENVIAIISDHINYAAQQGATQVMYTVSPFSVHAQQLVIDTLRQSGYTVDIGPVLTIRW